MRDEYGWTALMFAAEKGHLEYVKILAPLEKGMKDKYGKTALCFTTYSSSNKECAEFLWQFPEERDTTGLEELKRKHNLSRI